MRLQAYLVFQIWLFIFTLVKAATTRRRGETETTDIYDRLHEKEYFCGEVLSNTLDILCIHHNGPRRMRRNISHECCRHPCTRFHIMKHYCSVPRVPIDDITPPPPEHSTVSPFSSLNNSPRWKNSNTQEESPASTERAVHTDKDSNSEEAKVSVGLNKIQKQKADSEVDSRPAANFGMTNDSGSLIIAPGYWDYVNNNINNRQK